MTDEEKKRLWQEKLNELETHFGSTEDYHDQLTKNLPKRHIACYKCKAGCIHLEYDSLMMSFAESEFIEFSDVVIQLRNSIIIEKLQQEDEEYVYQGLM